ncbi:MAG: hypothetical protein R3F31_14525 [Verrucomicrobiales bacterium]
MPFDLDDATMVSDDFAKRVAGALDRCLECQRVGVMVIGTEVPHAHVHLIPFLQERQVA